MSQQGDTVPAAAAAVAVPTATTAAAGKSSFVASRLAALQQASSSPPKSTAAPRPQPNKLQPPPSVAQPTAAVNNNATPTKKPSHHAHSASVAQFSVPAAPAEDSSVDAAAKSSAAVTTSSPAQSTPTHVRRNSAPKGAVTSLLSFWRNQDGASSAAAAEKKAAQQREQAAQDSRIVAQRVSVLLERDAKVQQHAQQLAAASPLKQTGAKKPAAAVPSSSDLAPPVLSPPALSPAPSTLSPSSPHDHDEFEESVSSCGPARDVSSAAGSSSSPAQPGPPLLPPPTTLTSVLSSPAQVEHEGTSEDLHGRPELQAARVVSDPLPSTHAHDASAAPQPFLLPSPETLTPHTHADHAAAVLPMPLPLAQPAFVQMPPLTRCITDYDQDGQGQNRDEAEQQQQQQKQFAPSQPQHTMAPPPLQREITDNIDMCSQGDGGNNDITAGFVHTQQQQPGQPQITAFGGLPSLKREVTDLGAETNNWNQQDDDQCQPQDRQHQQQPAAAVPTHAPPPLSRLVTDPAQDEGHVLSGVSLTEAIARDTSIDSSGGSRRSSTAAGDKSASLYPPPSRTHQSHADVSNTNAVLLTRLATDVGLQQSQPAPQPHESSSHSQTHALSVYPPTMLQRAHTEFNLLAEESEAEATADSQQSLAVPAQAHPMGLPMLTRVQTEMNVASYGEENDDSEAARQQQQAHQASGNLTAGLPLISRVATEGNLDPHLRSAAHAHSDSAPADPQQQGLGAGFKLTRQTTDVRAADSDADTEVADDEPTPDAAALAAETPAEAEAADTVQDLTSSPQTLKLVISHSTDSGPASVSAASSSSSAATPSALSLDCATPGSASGQGFGFGLVQPVSPLTPLAVVQALVAPPPQPPSPSPVQSAAAEGTAAAAAEQTATEATATDPAAAAPTAESLAAAASMRAFRLKVEAELLSTEESYVGSLHTLVTHFIHPLKTAGESLHVTAAQIALIFSNIELLYNFHCIFLADLSKAVKISQKRAAAIERGEVPAPEPTPEAGKKGTSTVADVILKFADFLRMYTQYLAGYSVSLDTIAGLRSNGKFMSFLQEKRISAARDSAGTVAGAKPSAGLDLMSYLIMPVQRIPRYLLLLKELLRFTPRDHPELERLQDAYTKVQTIARHVNEQQRHVENMSVLLSIQNSIESSSLGQLGQLMVPSRRLVKSALLPKLEEGLLSASTKLRRVYLFNDILLWCETAATESASSATAAAAAPSGSEKFAGFIELDKCTVSEYTAAEKKATANPKIGFKLAPVAGASKKQKDVIFYCKSAEDQQKWVEEIGALQMGVVVAAEEARRRRMDSRVKNAAGAVAATGGLAAARLSNASMRNPSVGNAADAGLVTPTTAALAATTSTTTTTTQPTATTSAAPAATAGSVSAASATAAASVTTPAPASASASAASSSSSSSSGGAAPPANMLGMVSARLLAAVPLPSKGRYERKYGSAIVVSPRAAAAAAAAQAHAKLMRHAIASAQQQQQQQPSPTSAGGGAGAASLDSMAAAMSTRNPLRTGVAGGALLGPNGAPLTYFAPPAAPGAAGAGAAAPASTSAASGSSVVLESPVVALMTPEEWQDAQKLAATLLMRRPRASSF